MAHGDRKFDIVVFGATGFTGQFVVEEVARVAGSKRWAIAGRTQGKLDMVLKTASENTGMNLHAIPKIIADVSDETTLKLMAQNAHLVISCVGPYRLYGEPLVRACVENAAHYVDISGEPTFLEGMQLRYHHEAQQNGVYIVSACGFDSIPCEMGLQFTKAKFQGDLNSVDTYVDVQSGPLGNSVNFGTFHSMIHGVASRGELTSIRRQLMPNWKQLPKSAHRATRKGALFHNEHLNGWCMPFMGSDKSVVNRTQYYDYFERKQRPIQVNTYFKAGSLAYAVGMLVWGVMFFVLCSFSFTRKLMETYPKAFTFGVFSHDGPTRAQLKDTKFSYWFFGKGWKNKRVSNANEQHDDAPRDTITCRVDGPDPGYVGTAACLVASAMTILEEHSQMPGQGGVLPPGAAFEKTNLIDRLQRRGVKFQVVNDE